MKLHNLWPFAFGVAVMLSMISCTKTVTEPGTVDTLRDTTRDTLQDTLGLGHAWVRFVSMYPSPIRLSTANGTLFTIAYNTCGNLYIPLRADSSYMFYLSDPSNSSWSDSLPIGVQGYTLNTWALFPVGNNADYGVRRIDSEKFNPPPPGYCFLRFIDGIADGPGTDQYYIDIDTIGKTPFSGADGSPYSYKGITRYVLIKANTNHTVYLQDISTHETPVQNQSYFHEGFYYTARIVGSIKDNTAQIIFDQE